LVRSSRSAATLRILLRTGQANANRSVLDQALGSSKVKLQLFYEVQRSSIALGLALYELIKRRAILVSA
jgi:hypothetical protein